MQGGQPRPAIGTSGICLGNLLKHLHCAPPSIGSAVTLKLKRPNVPLLKWGFKRSPLPIRWLMNEKKLEVALLCEDVYCVVMCVALCWALGDKAYLRCD